jgi:hypothetical protein
MADYKNGPAVFKRGRFYNVVDVYLVLSIIYFSELSLPDCMPDISVTRLSLKSACS